jgi:hypothetical protein
MLDIKQIPQGERPVSVSLLAFLVVGPRFTAAAQPQPVGGAEGQSSKSGVCEVERLICMTSLRAHAPAWQVLGYLKAI